MYESNKPISVRVTSDLHELVGDVSWVRGEDISSCVRRAVLRELERLGFLSEDPEKGPRDSSKALEGDRMTAPGSEATRGVPTERRIGNLRRQRESEG